MVSAPFVEHIFRCRRKSHDLLQHSLECESLAIWCNYSVRSTVNPAFSGEPDEREQVRHHFAAVNGFLVGKQMSEVRIRIPVVARVMTAIVNGTG